MQVYYTVYIRGQVSCCSGPGRIDPPVVIPAASFRFEREPHRLFIPVRPVNRSEDLNSFPAFPAGDHGLPVLQNGTEEVSDLQSVVMFRGVYFPKAFGIFLSPYSGHM